MTLLLRLVGDGGTVADGLSEGDGGTEDPGDGVSTIHMRCDRVATSFATVCARVLNGVTWKTGYESFPSAMPRSERITVMKCMQVESSSGSEAVDVRSLTSTCDMLPTTFLWLSSTGRELMPWCSMRSSASLSG